MALADAYVVFRTTLTNLFLLDQRTQEHDPPLATTQLYIINEAILLRAFRALENLAEEAFIHYAFGNPTLSGAPVTSFIRPKDSRHAYEILRSSQPFLEWNSPQTVISRAETYLENGGPIKAAYASKQSLIIDIRRIRNHIAHNSQVSLEEYKKLLNNYLLTIPLVIPEPGDFLQNRVKRQPTRILRNFLEQIDDIGALVAN
jgi:hypothetical protein